MAAHDQRAEKSLLTQGGAVKNEGGGGCRSFKKLYVESWTWYLMDEVQQFSYNLKMLLDL